MLDNRINKMARVLVNYSLMLQKDDLLLIMVSDAGMPLAKEVFREALKVGAQPAIKYDSLDLEKIKYDTATDEMLDYVNPIDIFSVNNIDAFLMINGASNIKALSNVKPEKLSRNQVAVNKILKVLIERSSKKELKWSLCQFPTNSNAQESNMSLDEYADFVFGACLLNNDNPVREWTDISNYQEKIIDYLKSKSIIEVKSEDTDITLSVKGRTWINSDGKNNFPSGEVFTAPLEDSINGHIRFSFPGIFMGQEIEDIRLEFKNGKIIKGTAAKGQKLLDKVLETDEGCRSIGEFAIGTNYGISRFTKNMLFDEKIGGTIHMAIGNAYPESGGTNKSAIHWDLLCDMRTNGKIFADGELFYENGKFTIEF